MGSVWGIRWFGKIHDFHPRVRRMDAVEREDPPEKVRGEPATVDHQPELLDEAQCHARHMNHSQRFWRLVGSFEPDFRKLDKDLNSCWNRIPTWVGLY